MSHYDEILAGLEIVLSQHVRHSGSVMVPERFLTVVDFFYGEPMDGDPRFRAMAEWKSSDFTVRLHRWLSEMSQQLRGSSVSDAAEVLRASAEFLGRFLAFTSLRDFALWFADPSRDFLDAYESHYIDHGLPILSVSPFMDGRPPKFRKRLRKK